MKRFFTLCALSISLVMAGSFKNAASAQVSVGVNITYQDFYDELSPYGQWMDYPDYGYVWVPNLGNDFSPYQTNGHWVWSDDYEWMWASDYSWGWAPFHYGRWLMDPAYGWVWVPGYEWSPAWVAWRDGGDYYGWAPLRPGFNISIGFNTYNPPIDYWCFTPRRYISSPRIHNYYMPRTQNVTIINNTTIINNYGGRRTNNYFISNGPRRMDAERYAGRINSVRVRDINSPGRSGRSRGNEISIYRPNIQRDGERNFAPRSFERYDRSRGNSGNNGNGGDRNIVRRNENNLPERRNDRGDNRFDRNDNNPGSQPRQRDVNDNGNDRRMRDRGNGDVSTQPGRPSGMDRNRDRQNRVFDRSNNGNGNNPAPQAPQENPGRMRDRSRGFDRNNGGGNNPTPMEQPGRRMDRPSPGQQPGMERQRPAENNNRFEQRERRMSQPQQQPQDNGRRFEQRQERRMETPSRPSQENNGNRGGGRRGRF